MCVCVWRRGIKAKAVSLKSRKHVGVSQDIPECFNSLYKLFVNVKSSKKRNTAT